MDDSSKVLWIGWMSFFSPELLLEYSISPISLVAFFPSSWPRLSGTAPVRLFPLIILPSILFVSFLQLLVVFLSHLHSFTLLFCPFSVLELTPAPLCPLLGVCSALTAPLSHSRPSNPDSSALFLLLWWMLVCFSFAGRILALWGQGECFSPATGVLSWVYICSCFNNVSGKLI